MPRKYAVLPGKPRGGSRIVGRLLRQVLSQLTAQQRKVIELIFGLRDGTRRTCCTAGEQLGIPQTRIRRIKKSALVRLLKKSGLLEIRINRRNAESQNTSTFTIKDERVVTFPRAGHISVPIDRTEPVRIGIDHIRGLTCEAYGVTSCQMNGYNRHGSVAFARQVAMYLIRNDMGISYPRIADVFGRKAHGTIMCGINKMKALYKQSSEFREDIKYIRSSY